MMILGYWDIRGLGHAIRLLLEYTGTLYEEKRYVEGDAPDNERSQWTDEKETLGLDFPNLPYLLDGDIKLTQSNTILQYIGRKHGLCGNTENEENFVSLFVNEAMDFRMRIATLSYDPQFEQLKGPYIEKLPTVLARYSRFLGQRHWFVGDQLTIADILIYDALDQHKILSPTCLQNYKNLEDFLIRFEALPAIAAYLKTPRCKKTPINGKTAFWSNK
ncbi:glutathione S-transferase Mu 4-like [Dendrobates tinctorius]|uniref:glutathione S-transferase Mu 4-like n=1 Tax=Dendrobates tinctorius TaxID=92724 RepID=UPI003CCA2030